MNTASTDQHASGLLYASDLDGKGGCRDITWTELQSPVQQGQTRWVHLDYTEKDVADWLKKQSGLDESVTETLLQSETRPRSLLINNGLLVTLRGVNLNSDSNTEDMVSIRLWIEKDLIISTRKRRLRSVQQIRDELLAGKGPTGPAGFLIKLVDNLGDNIAGVVEGLDDAIEQAESTIAEKLARDHYGDLAKLRRQTAHLRRYLAPQRDALERLSRMQTEFLSASHLALLYEDANRLTLFVEELDLARERAVAAREEMLSNLAQDQNSKIYMLSMVAALFLPLSFLTGLFGMNVAGLPGLENPSSFLIISALMVAIAVGILLFFHWKKWL